MSRWTHTYPVDVTITTYRRIFITARSPEEAEQHAARIAGELNDVGRARLPISPAAPDVEVRTGSAGDPVPNYTTDLPATYAWWSRIEPA